MFLFSDPEMFVYLLGSENNNKIGAENFINSQKGIKSSAKDGIYSSTQYIHGKLIVSRLYFLTFFWLYKNR